MRSRWVVGFLGVVLAAVLFFGMPPTKARANGWFTFVEPAGETPGDVAIFPFYDVSSATSYNYFYLVNTVNYYMQVHIRFRTMECSIECLDFDVILSPYDVFTFWVFPDINGLGPGFYSADSNTIGYSGLMPAAWKSGSPVIAQAPFDNSRLLDLHISASDTQDMLKKGYVEAIVEGLIDPNFWGKCGPFKSLLAAAKTDIADGCAWDAASGQNGPWSNFSSALDNVGKAGYLGGSDALCQNATISDAQDICHGTLVLGNEYFLDFNNLTGYGVNAATLVGFRVHCESG